MLIHMSIRSILEYDDHGRRFMVDPYADPHIDQQMGCMRPTVLRPVTSRAQAQNFNLVVRDQQLADSLTKLKTMSKITEWRGAVGVGRNLVGHGCSSIATD